MAEAGFTVSEEVIEGVKESSQAAQSNGIGEFVIEQAADGVVEVAVDAVGSVASGAVEVVGSILGGIIG